MAQIKYNLGDLGKEKYSTEEIAIGTWIDGKTIYRKVLLCTKNIAISSSDPWLNIQGWSETSNLNIKNYVNINLSSMSLAGRMDYMIQDDKSLKFGCFDSKVIINAGSPLILEYTKTTDA